LYNVEYTGNHESRSLLLNGSVINSWGFGREVRPLIEL